MFYSFFSQIGFFRLILTLGFFIFSINLSYGAEVRCELTRDSCLDLSRVTSQTITVPSNTTRIDKNALDVCLPYFTSTTAVDLIFIVDQSTSMAGNDRNFMTSPAVNTALDLIDTLAPNSNVGFFGFSNGICDGTQTNGNRGAGPKLAARADTRVFPERLVEVGHKEKLLEHIIYDSDNFYYGCGDIASTGTNYYRPFLLAKDWMNQLDTRNKKIIIFLTDGQPNKEQRDFTALIEKADSTNFPTVHAIFAGSRGNNELENLTTRTGGIYSQIDDFTKLKGTMLKMIGATIVPNAPDNTVIKKNGTIVSQTANHTHVNLTRFQVNLDHDLALDTGANLMDVSSATSWLGSKSSSVKIEVNGARQTTTGTKSLSGQSIFNLACHDVSTIVPKDKSYSNSIEKLGAFNNTGFGVELKTPADDITAVINVGVTADKENLSLEAMNTGYRGPAVFSNTALATPGNNVIEGKVGDSILFTWVHPHDPRDFASASLPIFDNRADTTMIIFKDTSGNEITKINDLSGKRFKVVVVDNKAKDTLSVQLTSSHKDTLTVALQQVAPQTFESIVSFDFIAVVNPANRIIEGVFDATSATNQTIVTARVKKGVKSVTLRKIYVPVKKAWIIDGNSDGAADMVFIKFIAELRALPIYVSDIRWPSDSSSGKRAPASDATPAINPLSFHNSDKSMVLIDLTNAPFEFGATSASTVSPPTLTLPDGRKIVIQDSIKPVITLVEKKPSDFASYIRASDGEIINNPDTLFVSLSEPITPIPNVAEPWKSLLLVEKDGDLLPVDILDEPVVLSNDGRDLMVLVSSVGDNTVNKDDPVTLNPNAQYKDEKKNTMARFDAPTSGRDGVKTTLASVWRGGPVSGDKAEKTTLPSRLLLPVVDEDTKTVIRYENSSLVDTWVRPAGMDLHTGNVDFNYHKQEGCADDRSAPTWLSSDCLAARLVLTGASDGPYITYINIYDHLGKFIRGLKQAFGYCGELSNPDRVTENGLIMNNLVWNLKDSEGKVVGNGVYIWIVNFKFKDTKLPKKRIYKIGVASNDQSVYDECINNLRSSP